MSQESLEIIYQDEHIVLVNKPSGLLSIPGRGIEKLDSVTTRIKALFPQSIEQPSVHRLDMDTSGLILMALDKESHRHLSKQFQNREVFKRYIAVLDGIIEQDSGRIELPFRLDVDNRPLQIYDPVHGKVGITDWKKIATEYGKTRIEFVPLTGRTHQLRVHSAHEKGLGTPIVGDTFYGGHTRNAELQLHATQLRFEHPSTGEQLDFEVPPKF